MIRLFVDADLAPRARIAIGPEPAHYLTRVMRLGAGGPLLLFNGRQGEWRAVLGEFGKGGGVLVLEVEVRSQTTPPDLDLIVALVKRARLEAIVEKSVELGVRRIRLVTSERTNADHTNVARLAAIATEAAEQSGRLDVPTIVPPRPLADVLADWTPGRRLMFCDEAGEARPAAEALHAAGGASWAVLVGPEGGFSSRERAVIRDKAWTTSVCLGPRILRADTAAISALTLWQSTLGDWRGLEVKAPARQVN